VKQAKSRKLAKAGWRSGSVKDFVGLSDEEETLIEMRLSLSRSLRERRVGGGLSQSDLAEKMGSSQSRIAKMEAADSSVSLDLLIRSLLTLGASTKDIARAIQR
jgi:ribosome-binding protein aMBF1 (putative translation factor)